MAQSDAYTCGTADFVCEILVTNLQVLVRTICTKADWNKEKQRKVTVRSFPVKENPEDKDST